MATYADVMATVSSLMNDTAQTVYTQAAILPYLNMSIDELQEIFGHNNLPITNETSDALIVPAGTLVIDFSTTPALPSDLLEIQRVWESVSGENSWIPMTRKDFLKHYSSDIATNQFIFWAWIGQAIHLPLTNQDNDLKLDYIASKFAPIAIDDVDDDLPVLNSKSWLAYHTAALCSMFIAENPERAQALAGLSEEALSRTLGINVKGRQSIATRRRPFRASYKSRGPFV